MKQFAMYYVTGALLTAAWLWIFIGFTQVARAQKAEPKQGDPTVTFKSATGEATVQAMIVFNKSSETRLQINSGGRVVLTITEAGEIRFGEGINPSQASKEAAKILSGYMRKYLADGCADKGKKQ